MEAGSLALRPAFGLFGILAGVEFPVDVMPAVEESLAPVEESAFQRIGLGEVADGAVEVDGGILSRRFAPMTSSLAFIRVILS